MWVKDVQSRVPPVPGELRGAYIHWAAAEKRPGPHKRRNTRLAHALDANVHELGS